MPKKVTFLQLVVKGDKEKAETWIKKGLPAKELERTDVGGYTALTQAALLGHHQILRHMRLSGVDMDKKDACGRTALYVASLIGRVNVVKVLLDGDVDISMRCTDQCQNAVEAAIEYRHPEVVKLLGAAAGRLLLEDLRTGSLERAQEWLLWPGLDTNVQSFQGSTPLHLAMQFGNTSIVQGLAKLGADPTAKNRAGITPFDVARGHKNDHLLHAFESAQEERAEIPVAKTELPTEDKERRPLVSGSGVTQKDLVKKQRRRTMAPGALNASGKNREKRKTFAPGQAVSGGLQIGLPEVASGGWKHKKAEELGLTIDAILMTRDDNDIKKDRVLVDLSRKVEPPSRPPPPVVPQSAPASRTASGTSLSGTTPVPLGAIREAAQRAARAQDDEEDQALNSLLGFGSTSSLPPVPRKSPAAPTAPPPRPVRTGAIPPNPSTAPMSGHSRSKSTGAMTRSGISQAPAPSAPSYGGSASQLNPMASLAAIMKNRPPPVERKTQQPSADPPAPNFDPPAPKNDPPAPSFDPPAPGFDPPAPRKDPPAPRKDPPAPNKDPPAPNFDPPAPSFDPPAPRGMPRAPPRGRGRGGRGGRGGIARSQSVGPRGGIAPRGRPEPPPSQQQVPQHSQPQQPVKQELQRPPRLQMAALAVEGEAEQRGRAFTPHQLPLPEIPNGPTSVIPVTATIADDLPALESAFEVVSPPTVAIAEVAIDAVQNQEGNSAPAVSPRRAPPPRQASTPTVSKNIDRSKRATVIVVPRKLANTTGPDQFSAAAGAGGGARRPAPSRHARSRSTGGTQMKAAIAQSNSVGSVSQELAEGAPRGPPKPNRLPPKPNRPPPKPM